MARRIALAPTDVERVDLSFFSPCVVCASDQRTRSIVIRLGACPAACDHIRKVQQRLRGIRRTYQPGAHNG